MTTILFRNDSFEHPKHMFKLMGKEINAFLGAQMILIWSFALYMYSSMFGVHRKRQCYYCNIRNGIMLERDNFTKELYKNMNISLYK